MKILTSDLSKFGMWLGILVFALSQPLTAQVKTETISGRAAVSQRVLIKFRAPNSALVQAIQQIADADDVRPLGRSSDTYLFHSRSKTTAILLALLQARNEVAYVEPDYILHTNAVPNDPNLPQLWGLKNNSVPGADISAQPAWDISQGSTANVVGVIDTGIDYNHPDLISNVWTAPTAFTVSLSFGAITCPAGSHGYNAINRTCDPADDNGHGTHVSGTIGAIGNNGLGVVGVNWRTQILSAKFLDSGGNGSVSDAIDAIEFTIQLKARFAGTGTPVNVRVLSNSWGGGPFSQALLDEINKANTNDMLFVVAAGNAGANNDSFPSYPAAYQSPNLVTVAATDSNDALAGFSNYGRTTVHLGAPGVNILSTLPGSSYGYLSGTSMATPYVSGAAILVLSACSINTATLKATLLNTVDVIPSLTNITVSGGRLNVNKAIGSCGGSQGGGSASIWSSSATPANPSYFDPNPAELGMKFRSDVAGTVTGIRFYKGSLNTGTHTGELWTSTGTLLATGTFTNETASGWQQMTFATPVAIAANTTYIASYHESSGYLAVTTSFFTNSGIDNAPLHALKAGVDGPNGVYAYSSGIAFPSQSSPASPNYWVDVLFTASSSPPPTTSSIWSSTATPVNSSYFDPNPVELGVKFRSDVAGTVTGIRFYKGSLNTGTHTGELWTSTGTLLATGTFTNETASGWQQMTFATPVAIAANTTYIASYHESSGYLAVTTSFFTNSGADNSPLHALKTGVDGPNGVYAYSSGIAFPSQSSPVSPNYWVDVLFTTSSSPPPTTIWSSTATPVNSSYFDPNPVELGVKFRSDVAGTVTGIRFYKGSLNTGTHTGELWTSTGTLLATGTFTNETASGWQQMTFATPVAIAANTTYIASYHESSGYLAVTSSFFTNSGADNSPLHALQAGVDGPNGVYAYSAGIAFPSQSSPVSPNYWVDVLFTTSSSPPPTTIWSSTATPVNSSYFDPNPVELGVKFRSDVAGTVTGIRFYKGVLNTGTHTGELWTSTGTLLATGTFTNETASGWQQMTFATPVAIAANTTYIASYHESSGYLAVTTSFFTNSGVDTAPLHALQAGVDGPNGVYVYSAGIAFPSQSSPVSPNYWVDVLFTH